MKIGKKIQLVISVMVIIVPLCVSASRYVENIALLGGYNYFKSYEMHSGEKASSINEIMEQVHENRINAKGEESNGFFSVPIAVIPEDARQYGNSYRSLVVTTEDDRFVGYIVVKDYQEYVQYRGNILNDGHDYFSYEELFENYPLDEYDIVLTEYYITGEKVIPVTVEIRGEDSVTICDFSYNITDSIKTETNELRVHERGDSIRFDNEELVYSKNSKLLNSLMESLHKYNDTNYVNKWNYYRSYEWIEYDNDIFATYNYIIETGTLKIKLYIIIVVFVIVFISLVVYLLKKATQKAYKKFYETDYRLSVINGLAHDLKSSFMVIEGSAENVIEGTSPEKKKVFDRQIFAEIDRLDVLLNKMRQFEETAHIENDLRELIDINALAHNISDRYSDASSERNVVIEFQEEDTLTMVGDPALYDIILDNFVSNALKYSLTGEKIIVKIDKESFYIYNTWEPVKEYINNPDKFFKTYDVGNEERNAKNGSGLGLSISANILDYYHVNYKAKADGRGVSFEIKKKNNN